MTTKRKTIKVPIDVYFTTIIFLFNMTEEEALRTANKYFGDPIEKEFDGFTVGQSRGLTLLKQGYSPIIWMPNMMSTCEEYGTFHHEIFHAVKFILGERLTFLSNDTEETFAGLTGYVVQEIYKKIKAAK